MKSIKKYIENHNEKKIFKNTTIRKNSEKSRKFGKSESGRKNLENSEVFRQIRKIWQPWSVRKL
jgi:hypothetical protein